MVRYTRIGCNEKFAISHPPPLAGNAAKVTKSCMVTLNNLDNLSHWGGFCFASILEIFIPEWGILLIPREGVC